MGKSIEPSRYWHIARVTSSGEIRIDEISAAKALFLQVFSADGEMDEQLSDSTIQRQLIYWSKTDEHSYGAAAKDCLRCYISNALKLNCQSIISQFCRSDVYSNSHKNRDLDNSRPDLVVNSSENYSQDNAPTGSTYINPDQITDPFRNYNQYNLTAEELYVRVLDSSSHRSELIDNILVTFDPDKSSLSNWTKRLFTGYKAVKRVLLDYGIEKKTNWLILNESKTHRLKRLLQDYERTPREINEATSLLEAFHEIYRTQVLSELPKGQRYPTPTTTQLIQIADRLLAVVEEHLTAEDVMKRLQNLAQILRQYRAHKSPPASPASHDSQVPDLIPEDVMSQCLKKAVYKVLNAHIEMLRNSGLRGQRKAEKLAIIMKLYYCQGLSLSKIADELGLGHQSTVTRLLERTKLQKDISRNLLECLSQCLYEQVKGNLSPCQLKSWEAKVYAFLESPVADVIQTANKQAQTSKNRRLDDPLSIAMCQYAICKVC